MTDDARWLKQFVDEGSEDAFERLVRKHVHLVYSAALRQLKDAARAEDITQLTFIALSQKAPKLREECALSAWLLVTVRYLCLDTLKANARRQRHEQTAAAMSKTIQEPASRSQWEEFSPYLDAAMASLNPQDRRAITLRYFEGQSIQEVAQSMGTSLDAAKQRVHRATLRLRKFFVARGVTVTASVIGPAITAFAVQTAPPHIAASALSAGLATKTAVATSVSVKGAAVLMASAKIKIIAAAIVIVLLGGGAVATYRAIRPPAQQVIVIQPADPATIAPPGDWIQAFNARYGLSDGQVVRNIQPPYGPERQVYFDNDQRRNHQGSFPLQNTAVTYMWDGHAAHWSSIGGNGNTDQALRFCAGLKPYEVDRSCLAYDLNGDWVARQNATTEQILGGIAELISQKAHHPVHFVHRLVRRDTIVVRGAFAATDKLKGGVVSLVRKPSTPNAFVERDNFGRFLTVLEGLTSKKVYNETNCSSKMPISWRHDTMSGDDSEHMLQTISSQTSLHFDIEPREIMVWFLESGPAATTAPAV